MGMYGEVEIIATFETEEQADKVFDNLEEKVNNFIKSKLGDEPFYFGLYECDLDGACIIIKLGSDRYQNAQWQGEQILDYMKTTKGLYEFTGDIIMPENFLWWNKDEE